MNILSINSHVHYIAGKTALGNTSISKLDEAIKYAILELKEKRLLEAEAPSLYADLEKIKTLPAKEGVERSNLHALMRKVDWLLNGIRPSTPDAVRLHPAYFNATLLVDPDKNDYGREMRVNAERKLKDAADVPENRHKLLYLMRDSTADHDYENLQVFTLSTMIARMRVILHLRLAYNTTTQAWQVAGYIDKDAFIYDRDGSQPLHKLLHTPVDATNPPNRFLSLEGLVNFYFQAKRYRPEDVMPLHSSD
jgi:hypothetical protein